MGTSFDNESWVVEAGAAAITKKAGLGDADLSPIERLVYCLWVADYGMRNAGDLDMAQGLYADFQQEAAHIAEELRLEFTHESFSLPAETFQRQYFERFDRICNEIKSA